MSPSRKWISHTSSRVLRPSVLPLRQACRRTDRRARCRRIDRDRSSRQLPDVGPHVLRLLQASHQVLDLTRRRWGRSAARAPPANIEFGSSTNPPPGSGTAVYPGMTGAAAASRPPGRSTIGWCSRRARKQEGWRRAHHRSLPTLPCQIRNGKASGLFSHFASSSGPQPSRIIIS